MSDRDDLSVPDAVEQHPLLRYANIAVALHWITAAVVLAQVAIGFRFKALPPGADRIEAFTWHKTVGAAILLLAVVRLAVRLVNPPPPFPPELPRWERVAAVWTHRAFYFLLIVLPLTGLTAVSGRTDGATTPLLGGLALPLFPGVSEGTGEISGEVHEILVFTTIALLVLHVGAALKQQFFDRPGRMAGRMPPFRARTHEPTVSD
ncbi:MAG: cytochrome b/b6 domain-containing protein [Sphingomicrobium sp.]